jgi:type II secretory pathway predicted ATPase ExeA
MSRAYQSFGLERDPFLDTSDPHFFWEMPSVARAKAKLLASIEESRGLTVVVGDPGSGKTSLALAIETTLLVRDDVLLGKILDPHFASETEFLLAVGRAFGLSLPARTPAFLKNALKNFLFDAAVLESRTIVLFFDEAQTLSSESLETLRLLLNFDIPQRKLLNLVLFGQSELEPRIRAQRNLLDRVDSWIRLAPLDEQTARGLLMHRLARAGARDAQTMFTEDALDVVVRAAGGLPRRLIRVARGAMEEAAAHEQSRVFEEAAFLAARERGIVVAPRLEPVLPPPPQEIEIEPAAPSFSESVPVPVMAGAAPETRVIVPDAVRGFGGFMRLFTTRKNGI